VHYVLTLIRPQPAANGTGAICSIVFHTKDLGAGALHIGSAILLTSNVTDISVTLHDGSVRIGMDQHLYLPLIVKGRLP
jgi:hypothetical protein